MRIAEKYGIEETKIKMIIKDGHMSCSYQGIYDEVYYYYQSQVSKGVSVSQAVHNTHVQTRLSERRIYEIIKMLK